MTEQYFKSQIARLINVYGDKYYPQERVSIFWKWAKNKDQEIFYIAVCDLIADSSTAPLMSKIQEEYRQAQKRLGRDGYLEKWIAAQPECRKCGKNGFLVATNKTTKEVFAFNCTFCEIGTKTNPSFPAWNESLSESYEVEFNNVTEADLIQARLPKIFN